jgi:hypothetical protein
MAVIPWGGNLPQPSATPRRLPGPSAGTAVPSNLYGAIRAIVLLRPYVCLAPHKSLSAVGQVKVRLEGEDRADDEAGDFIRQPLRANLRLQPRRPRRGQVHVAGTAAGGEALAGDAYVQTRNILGTIRTALARISHHIRCIWAWILRGSCCSHGFLETIGSPNADRM